MNDEQRFRVYRNIARRIVWERRAYVCLWGVAAFLCGFGLGWSVAPR
ncbi:MAG: hypothetical protein AB7U18_01075 [Dehalococcoidia bacterium]